MVGEALELPSLDERHSVRSQVIHALRAALVAGQMQPGQVYSAPVLAATFGVSPTPVREAMLELAKEGLVTTVPNKGFRVRELSDRELDEVTDIRLLLEVPATVRIVDLATAGDLTRLRPMANRLVATAKSKDLLAYVEQDRQFHLELLALAGNAALVSTRGRAAREVAVVRARLAGRAWHAGGLGGRTRPDARSDRSRRPTGTAPTDARPHRPRAGQLGRPPRVSPALAWPRGDFALREAAGTVRERRLAGQCRDFAPLGAAGRVR